MCQRVSHQAAEASLGAPQRGLGQLMGVINGWGITAGCGTTLGISMVSLAGVRLGKLTTLVRTGRVVVASASLTGKIAWPAFCTIKTSGGDLWVSLVI